jgi:hypothetical protein
MGTFEPLRSRATFFTFRVDNPMKSTDVVPLSEMMFRLEHHFISMSSDWLSLPPSKSQSRRINLGDARELGPNTLVGRFRPVSAPVVARKAPHGSRRR